jgi:hypothetical protein
MEVRVPEFNLDLKFQIKDYIELKRMYAGI